MEEVYKDASYAATFSLKNVLGARVLTPNGQVVGRISSVQSNASVSTILGVHVNRGLFASDWYIGREYFHSFTPESCILREEPVLFLRGKVVLSHEGYHVGHVKEVVRVDSTNKLRYLMVKRGFSSLFQVKPSHIASIGHSILLKEGTHVPKRTFWRSSS